MEKHIPFQYITNFLAGDTSDALIRIYINCIIIISMFSCLRGYKFSKKQIILLGCNKLEFWL